MFHKNLNISLTTIVQKTLWILGKIYFLSILERSIGWVSGFGLELRSDNFSRLAAFYAKFPKKKNIKNYKKKIVVIYCNYVMILDRRVWFLLLSLEISSEQLLRIKTFKSCKNELIFWGAYEEFLDRSVADSHFWVWKLILFT